MGRAAGSSGRQAGGCDVLVGAVVLPDGVVCGVSGSTFPAASLRNQTDGLLVSASDGFRGTALLFDQTGRHLAGRQTDS